MTMRTRLVAATLVAGAVASGRAGAAEPVLYDEAARGDLSNAFGAPTNLGTLALGPQHLRGSVVSGDRDYFRVTVGPGQSLSQITLVSFVSTDVRAFIGIQTGTVITENPDSPNVANLLGYTHFGPGGSPVGSDLLAAMGTGPGSIGFAGPRPAGAYSFWVQQLGAVTQYDFNFIVVPGPGVGVAGGSVLVALSRRGRRRGRA